MAADSACTLSVPFPSRTANAIEMETTTCESQRQSICSTSTSIMIRGGLGASLLSVRSSIQSSIRSVGIFLVAPFSKHRCCLGCVSLRDAIPLICVAELILLAMASVLVLDLWLSDGDLFYTKQLKGRGSELAKRFITLVCISFFVHFATILAWRSGRSRFYLIHALWQIIIVGILVYFFVNVVYLIRANDIIIASGYVICIFFTIVIFLQLWWFFVIIDAAFFETFYYRRSSSEEEETNGNVKTGTKTPRTPVVTVDCVSE